MSRLLRNRVKQLETAVIASEGPNVVFFDPCLETPDDVLARITGTEDDPEISRRSVALCVRKLDEVTWTKRYSKLEVN